MLRVIVDSTSIVSIGYDAHKRELEIEFRKSGDIYLYFDVPVEVHKEFMAVESKGAYLNQIFKPREYEYRIVHRGRT